MRPDAFELCYAGDPWTDVLFVVLLWTFPVVLMALWRQRRASRHAGLLGVALVLAGAVATLLTLPWMDVIRPSDPEYPFAVLLLGWSSAAAVGGIYLDRRLSRIRVR